MASLFTENINMKNYSTTEVRAQNLCKKHRNELINILINTSIFRGKVDFVRDDPYSIYANLLFPENFGYKFSFKIHFSPDIYLYLNKIKENKNPYYIKCTLIDITDIPLPHSSLPDDIDLFFEKYDDLIKYINESRKELLDKNSLNSSL